MKANWAYVVKSFPTLTDAERFVAGENASQGSAFASSPTAKFYAVKSGRIPGIYTDWSSVQDQITGWQKPKHRSFSTRAEAQRFLDDDDPKVEQQHADFFDPFTTELDAFFTSNVPEIPAEPVVQQHPQKKIKKAVNSSRSLKQVMPEYNEALYEPGTGPLPPGAEDGFDPNILLDPRTGKLVYKTQEQRQATKPAPYGGTQTGPIRIHTDGSSLGNGKKGAFAGVGVYFGPGDKRYTHGHHIDHICKFYLTSPFTTETYPNNSPAHAKQTNAPSSPPFSAPSNLFPAIAPPSLSQTPATPLIASPIGVKIGAETGGRTQRERPSKTKI